MPAPITGRAFPPPFCYRSNLEKTHLFLRTWRRGKTINKNQERLRIMKKFALVSALAGIGIIYPERLR
jgi:hypothetical protein